MGLEYLFGDGIGGKIECIERRGNDEQRRD